MNREQLIEHRRQALSDNIGDLLKGIQTPEWVYKRWQKYKAVKK